MRPEPEAAVGEDPIASVASGRFGIPYLYPQQRYVISNTLEGTSQIVVLPTGGGKSLCFQLPALLRGELTLVLVPILSLLADQVRRLESRGIPVGVLRGGQGPEERLELRRRIAAGTRIVYATPEVMLTASARSILGGLGVGSMVIDEAHCVCEWGESFRPAYLELGALVRDLSPRVVTAFTATGSPDIVARVRRILFGEREVLVFTGNPDRPNIAYAVVRALSKDHALERLVREAPKPLIVFGRSRRGVERCARLLRRRLGSSEVRFYHAGLDADERRDVEGWFLPSRDGVLAATSAYGMGVDKPDVRSVLHADVPLSPEAYLQESGRAGRDGAPSRAVLISSPEDERFAAGLDDELDRRRFGRMLAYAADSATCRRSTLLACMGVEADWCGGCDVCAGSAAAEPEGERAIMAVLSRTRRRLTPVEAAHLLAGARSALVVEAFLDRYAGFGALRHWRREDVEACLEELVVAGKLKVIGRRPWRGLLTVPRNRAKSPVRSPVRRKEAMPSGARSP